MKRSPPIRQALRIKPDSPAVLCNLGVVLMKAGSHDESVAVFKQAIALRPDYADAYYNMGQALACGTRESLTNAIFAYRQALRLQATISSEARTSAGPGL